MRVILNENVKGLGQKLDIKVVSDGYARNYLFPRGFARPAHDNSEREVKQLVLEAKKKEEADGLFLKQLSDFISKEVLVFMKRIGDKGEVFGSVSKNDILDELLVKFPSLKNHRLRINLGKPIRELGNRNIKAILGRGQKAEIKIELRGQK